MNRYIKIICVVICVCLLGGCGHFSLEERSIIEGIAIDKTEDGFLVTTQVYKQSPDEKEANKYEIHFSNGKTVYEALHNIFHTSGKQPFYAYNKIIIISQEALSVGIDNILDYFFRDNEIRHNTLVCCSEDKASDLLKIDNEGMLMPAERITTLLEIAGVPSYKTASGELLEVGTRMENETTDIYLPLIKLKTSEKDQKVAYVAGSVAFRESNPVYKLDNKETAGFCYLNNYVSNYPISVEYDGANYLFSIKKMKTKYDIQLENGKIKINVTFDADTILEEVTSQIRDIDDKQMKYIADMSGKEICNMAKQVTEDVFFGHKSDIFQIGSRVKKSHPKYFNTLESWVDTIDRCEFSFSHEITLSRIGENNRL